jgi:hypothetical protein
VGVQALPPTAANLWPPTFISVYGLRVRLSKVLGVTDVP